MEVNKEEALRCLNIAQKHRSSTNYPSALKFAKKSVSLYSTPEGEAMVSILQKEILVNGTKDDEGSGASTPNATAGSSSGGKARASGVEEHVSEAKQRAGHTTASGSNAEGSKKREYTPKQIEIVKRVKACKHHAYYEILSLEKTCEENDVKRSYKKLALQLHPDKNGAPGADEAFKMVSKAFQVLSDPNLRAAFDSNPHSDPTQRGGGGGGGGGGGMYRGGGGMPQGFGGNGMYTEINPEDLFNAFFGGGMGGGGFGGQANVFSFGGPGGFQTFGQPRRRAHGQPGTARQAETSPIIALLPVLILCAFALLSQLPSLFSLSNPDPSYSFEPSTQYTQARTTWNWAVPYYVNSKEWEGSDIWKSVPETRRGEEKAAMYSGKVRGFERGVEGVYAGRLRNECERFLDHKERRVAQESGFFGIGADHDKIRKLRAEKSPACEQLKKWGVYRQQQGGFF